MPVTVTPVVADYDERAHLEDYAKFCGLEWSGPPPVERATAVVTPDDGEGEAHEISMLRWGTGDPEFVFIHGGGQNAHTWDSVLLTLGRPAIALDMPGHGHSSWRADQDYLPWSNAVTLGRVLDEIAAPAHTLIGMSMGGLTSIRLLGERPGFFDRAVFVDVTPGVMLRVPGMTVEERGTTVLTAGPPVYESFDAMLDATAEHSPGRPRESLRNGVRHNARQLEDGSWRWRYDTFGRRREGEPPLDFTPLWDDIAGAAIPTMLVRGSRSKFVSDEDEAKYLALAKHPRVEHVEGAGHSVQSDQPVALAGLLADFAS